MSENGGQRHISSPKADVRLRFSLSIPLPFAVKYITVVIFFPLCFWSLKNVKLCGIGLAFLARSVLSESLHFSYRTSCRAYKNAPGISTVDTCVKLWHLSHVEYICNLFSFNFIFAKDLLLRGSPQASSLSLQHRFRRYIHSTIFSNRISQRSTELYDYSLLQFIYSSSRCYHVSWLLRLLQMIVFQAEIIYLTDAVNYSHLSHEAPVTYHWKTNHFFVCIIERKKKSPWNELLYDCRGSFTFILFYFYFIFHLISYKNCVCKVVMNSAQPAYTQR